METPEVRVDDFAENLRRHQTQIFAYIYSLVRDFDDADDLFQQTSLALWRKFDGFNSSKSFAAWACGVARFEVANFLRSRRRQRRHFSDALQALLADAYAELDQERLEERREALAECLKKLRPADREMLEDCYGGGGKFKEVADKWGRSVQSIHNSLSRVRRTLAECVRRRLESEALG